MDLTSYIEKKHERGSIVSGLADVCMTYEGKIISFGLQSISTSVISGPTSLHTEGEDNESG